MSQPISVQDNPSGKRLSSFLPLNSEILSGTATTIGLSLLKHFTLLPETRYTSTGEPTLNR